MMSTEKQFFICHMAAGHKHMWIFGKGDIALTIATVWGQAASEEYAFDANDAEAVQSMIMEQYGHLL